VIGLLNRVQPLGLLVLRVVLGIIMAVHGWQKIHGGMNHHVEMVIHLGMPGWLAYLSIAAEFFGGLLLIAGYATRIAAFFVLVDMLVALLKVHLHNGLTGQGGYQMVLALSAMAFAIIFTGAGAISLDWLIGEKGK
jgi:putative oxidoreductase